MTPKAMRDEFKVGDIVDGTHMWVGSHGLVAGPGFQGNYLSAVDPKGVLPRPTGFYLENHLLDYTKNHYINEFIHEASS